MVTTNWLVWAILSAVFAALTAILAKIGVQGVDSDFATLVRTGVVLGMLGAFIAWTDKWTDPTTLSSKTLLFLALSGAATAASWVCYFRALQLGPVALVAPVDKLSIVMVVIFAFAFLGERPAAKDWAGVTLIASGVLLITLRR